MITILMALAGIVLLIVGQLPVSFRRTIKGIRARLVGIALILPALMVFLVASVIAFMSGFNRQDFDPKAFDYFIGAVQLPIILLGLLIASVIAYWPQKRKTLKKADDDLAALYPGQASESLTSGQAAFQLDISDTKLQRLVNDGSLALVETNGNTFIDRASYDAFVLCRQGTEAAKNGQLESALIDFDEAVKLNPRSVRAYFLRGKANLSLGYIAEAYIDFQYVFDSGQKYPQIDDLLVRTRQALRSKSGTTKFTVNRNANSIMNDVAKGPIFLFVVLLVTMFAIVEAITPINELSTSACRKDFTCWSPYGTATTIADTSIRGTNVAIEATVSKGAASTETTIKTATANSFYATATQSGIQQRDALRASTDGLPGKLLITGGGYLYTVNPSERKVGFVDLSILKIDPRLDFRINAATWDASGSQMIISSTIGVFLVNADGSGAVKIANESPTTGPVMSPDNKLLALADTSLTNIYILDLNGLHDPPHWKPVVTLSARNQIRSLQWLPDGKSLSYCYFDNNGSGNIFVVSIDTASSRLLMTTDFGCAFSWSPDGLHIAYSKALQRPIYSSLPGPDWGLAIVNADGSAGHFIFWNSFEQIVSPSWSPDGRYIAFGIQSYSSQIFVIDADGTHLRAMNPSEGEDYETKVSWGP